MLLVVGVGINLRAHISVEAQAIIEQAEHVYYVLPEATAKTWLLERNDNAIDLSIYYDSAKNRRQTYTEMVEEVLTGLGVKRNICVVFYGHPAVFVTPATEMMLQARARGFAAQLLPGISAEDCLYADLNLDPAREGCQTYEATDFLIRPRRWDTTANLILWQVGVIGHTTSPADPIDPIGIQLLTERLQVHYPAGHQVVIYEAASHLLQRPRIEWVRLEKLQEAEIRPISTLYIPPSHTAQPDIATMHKLRLI